MLLQHCLMALRPKHAAGQHTAVAFAAGADTATYGEHVIQNTDKYSRAWWEEDRRTVDGDRLESE